MSNHEHFRELSALAAIGQLSLEEDRELNDHLRECQECRSAYNDYARVVIHELPLADAARWRMRSLMRPALPDSELRDRFLARARAQGIDFSAGAERPRSVGPTKLPWNLGWRAAPAVAMLGVLAVLGAAVALQHQLAQRPGVTPVQARGLIQENESLRTQLAALQADIRWGAVDLAQAKREKFISKESLKLLEKRLEESHRQTGELSAQLQTLEAKQKQLEDDNQQKGTLIADLNAKNEKMHRDNADNLGTRIILESQIRDLKESLQQQTANVERERQLMSASKEVRQLISARNLHILDVHDVDGRGKDSKAFGRVFYAEGQALVFYAFDLPSGKLSPAKYTFEAWGQKEYVERSVRNLGTFEVDDHEQRRWVLKVTDPTLLRGIDSVFVTAEALGDGKTPRGRKLLYAYIVGQANHP